MNTRNLLSIKGLLRSVAIGAPVCATLALPGCGGETDSWFFNPSVVGRWEETPTIVPVLERIDVIENDTGDFVEITQVTRDDLLPQPNEVRAKAGDPMKITILDFPDAGRPGEFQRVVDPLGYIDLPMMPRIKVAGMTGRGIQEAIERALVQGQLLDRSVVQVEFGTQEESTFRIFGYVEKSGQYRIPGPEYRLLQALTDAGGVSPVVRKAFIIRQVSLAAELGKTPPGEIPSSGAPTEPGDDYVPTRTPMPPVPGGKSPPSSGDDLLKVIDDLTGEPRPEPSPALPQNPPSAQPAGEPQAQPTNPPAETPPSTEQGALLSALSTGEAPRSPAKVRVVPLVAASAMSARQDVPPPEIDLPDSDHAPQPEPTPAPQGGAGTGGGQWVFLNGEWVQVFRKARAGGSLPEGADPLRSRSSGVEDILTQRVIEVPIPPLLQGAAQYNIVLRPGDVVHVPGPETGFVYAEGPGINRVGVYSLPTAGQLTIQRLVAAAGGLSEIAIPERVDITRRVGDKRQATIRLNLRAIYEGTQPDIVLKADDLVNFGTNFWAFPMAIIRNGFRMTYGFGFLLDRNFGSDVFGVPPESRARGFGN